MITSRFPVRVGSPVASQKGLKVEYLIKLLRFERYAVASQKGLKGNNSANYSELKTRIVASQKGLKAFFSSPLLKLMVFLLHPKRD